MSVSQDIEQLRAWMSKCPKGGMVFFGGAGVSTESGIPDFRSADGLYTQNYKYSPEQIVSHTFYKQHPKDFYDFYCEKMIFQDAEPNAAHKKLAELEQAGILSAVVTQNIDGLHQKAGSKKVFELHGSVHRNYCEKCGKKYTLDEFLEFREASKGAGEGIPRCPKCGGTVRPDVVLYEEGLDQDVMKGAIYAIANASLLVVAGTSLVVYPAAGLLQFFHGSHLAIVNLQPTAQDRNADLCIAAKVGEVFNF